MITIRKLILVGLCCGSLLVAPKAFGQDYSKEMKSMLKNSLKVDYKTYQFFGIPMSNFGVGTMYPEESKGNKFDVKTAGLYGDPNTWWTDIPDTQREAARKLIFPSGESGSVDLKRKKTKSISLSLALPALFKLVTGNGSFNWNKTTTVTLTADTAENHLINWTELDDATSTQHIIKESVAKHIHAKDFVITVGDVVLYGFTAHVAVTKGTDVKVGAQLTGAAAQLGKDSKLDFEYKSNADGSFDLKSKKPVVVAVYIGEPPAGALHSAGKMRPKAVMTPALLSSLQEAEMNHLTIPEN
jgi:hypothetical protein